MRQVFRRCGLPELWRQPHGVAIQITTYLVRYVEVGSGRICTLDMIGILCMSHSYEDPLRCHQNMDEMARVE